MRNPIDILTRLEQAKAHLSREETVDKYEDEIENLGDAIKEIKRLRKAPKEVAKYGWGILCDVSDGDWTKQTEKWQQEAVNFRDWYYYPALERPAALARDGGGVDPPEDPPKPKPDETEGS